jgi:putative sigma-54 modulation protein
MKAADESRTGITIQVKGKGLPITQALRDQVTQKMHRLDKYLDRLQSIEVELCHENTRESSRQNQVEATARVPGRTLRVATASADMYAAIDEAVDKLYRQLNRKKERMKAHHGVKAAEILPPLLESDEVTELDERQNGEAVIHLEQLEVMPEFEDEAVEQLELRGGAFYVFLNARNERINVLYRREDGSYGLIEPRLG